ncbi:A disintegrin and metalloproteinase with thrombospondin motifs 3 [Acipenser ruthenus]|uniref:A disintegrin and metalloproteinase with thrombospondin motifs 3 n=1 Tax=Acipenser ruthenus TaxID=7906 RepID=A0A444U6Y7_ACIRT|nr:A disintegrin and metalloproteinase with thrombospondin motifs 3 [Acipenser ruthenus]
MIRMEKEEFFIEPVESGGELGEEEQGGRQHIVYRKSSIKTSPSNQTSDFHGKGTGERVSASEPVISTGSLTKEETPPSKVGAFEDQLQLKSGRFSKLVKHLLPPKA